jgi:GNAT superfamily N-acetyltransferase
VPGDSAAAADLVIRDVRVEDAEAVAVLCEELGYSVTATQAAGRISDPHGTHMFVAVRGGEVLGWIELAERSTVEGHAVEIQGLVVTASARGQAIGSRLLASAETWAHDRGVPRMRVRSNIVRERTHGFYLKRGYFERKRQVVFDKTLDGEPSH